ncbi:Crp/Fnr family transcriptional regulator [Campylobacter sp.]|uniref:Crp/Fnr family transcriptional regulator n=1 Tax=Campylobacter sp. TaxID=205 RepID=UPI0026F5D5C8|nr:Crp/Fnr family transcriptional regulator [Campylobacter sp.]
MLSLDDKRILQREFIDKFEISDADAKTVYDSVSAKNLSKDTLIYTKDDNCGYIIVKSGVIRAFITSQNFKEITIFKLEGGDNCVICSSCTLNAFDTEITLSVEEDAEVLLIPMQTFKTLKDSYTTVLNHALKIVSKRFAAVINVMEQALFLPLANRVRNFLLENAKENELNITHEQLANHLGSAREAISRILKEMEKSGEIAQKRGKIFIQNLQIKS